MKIRVFTLIGAVIILSNQFGCNTCRSREKLDSTQVPNSSNRLREFMNTQVPGDWRRTAEISPNYSPKWNEPFSEKLKKIFHATFQSCDIPLLPIRISPDARAKIAEKELTNLKRLPNGTVITSPGQENFPILLVLQRLCDSYELSYENRDGLFYVFAKNESLKRLQCAGSFLIPEQFLN